MQFFLFVLDSPIDSSSTDCWSKKRSFCEPNSFTEVNPTRDAAESAPRRGTSRDQRKLGTYRTKPDLPENSKQGTSGTTISLSANYFKLIRKPQFEFNLYRIDFEPDLEVDTLRKRFVYEQRDLLGGYLFDGQNITRGLPNKRMEFWCESREGQTYKMIIKHTGAKIEMTDAMAMQVLNIILRRTMNGLEMQEVGRNMYDAKNKVS